MEKSHEWTGLRTVPNGIEEAPEYRLAAGEEARYTYDHAADWRAWDGIALEVWVPQGETVELTLEVIPLRVGRPEYITSATATAVVAGQGWMPVELSLDTFDYMKMTNAFWRLIHQVSIRAKRQECGSGVEEEIRLRGLCLKRRGLVTLNAERLSYAAEAGDYAGYSVQVTNESAVRQAVALRLDSYGFESVQPAVEPNTLLLDPGQSERVTIRAFIHEGMAPGGFEKLTLVALPNGDVRSEQRLTLYAVRRLPHPYIMHTESGWDDVLHNVRKYDWAKRELEHYIAKAEAWVVPETQGAGAAYAYELAERFNLHAAGVAWKLTGRQELLEKAMLFLRRFVDPVQGYPSTDAPVFHIYSSPEELELKTPRAVKVCGGGLIHEGEFMLDVASVYDLLYDAPGWSQEDRHRVEAAFRLFIEKVDWMITDGDTNNIPSGGMAGALLCSLVLQDMHWIRRFIHGPGGFADMVATGILDDGWYFEVATNYVQLFADMFTRVVQACEPWGLGLKHLQVPPSYRRNAMLSPWSLPREQRFLGMSFEKYGPVKRNYRSVRDVWDAMLPFVDHRGILFGTNDSTDKDMVRAYDLAYYIWRDPKYASVLKGADRRDLVYGVGEHPVDVPKHAEASAYADNAGLAILRSQKDTRIEAVIKYGTHGGYHGHFDRTGLVALMRYGKNAYGPLASWYGYHSFMFKMWVQASLSHNMVVVDGRMQEPVESKRLLFHAGRMLNACVVETVARWCDPPYGGQTPYPESFPRERGWIEGRELPETFSQREQGSVGAYSEPVLQRRLVAVTDDYVVIADYLRGEQEHVYDCLNHYQGYLGLEARKSTHVRHTGKMDENPFGAGQFITDCDWYACEAPALLRFSHDYDRWKDDSEGRHMLHNEEGRMELHLRSLWPPKQEIMTGWYAEAAPVNKRLRYEILADDRLLEQGQIGAWILGKRKIRVPLEGAASFTLRVNVEKASRKTVFWGDPAVLMQDGRRIRLQELPVEYRNVDTGNGPGQDYYGGPVHLEGEPYPDALPFEPADTKEPAEAVYDLTGWEAVAFEAVIGGDYPLGDDPARRKTISIRQTGREALFLTLLEPHRECPAIASAEAMAAGKLAVRLADGRLQELELEGFYEAQAEPRISIREWKEGQLLRQETANTHA
ncbi:COG1470 family protein [Paenibacillus silviterrae]|uniref:COG1470 family protein n=1 Tax=Paenibacillus silviterrae TaxID=3242194 RepID=UPI00254333E9|nr:heparinase II/III family protein [Paenibacillus chinjuensis]